jgi:hypothetical protein
MLLLLTAFLVALLIRFTLGASSANETTLKHDYQTLSYEHTPSSIEEKYTFTKPLHISNRINHIHRLMVNLTHATAGKSFNPDIFFMLCAGLHELLITHSSLY